MDYQIPEREYHLVVVTVMTCAFCSGSRTRSEGLGCGSGGGSLRLSGVRLVRNLVNLDQPASLQSVKVFSQSAPFNRDGIHGLPREARCVLQGKRECGGEGGLKNSDTSLQPGIPTNLFLQPHVFLPCLSVYLSFMFSFRKNPTTCHRNLL